MKQNHLDPDFFFLNGLHIYLKKCTLFDQPLDEMQLSKFNKPFFSSVYSVKKRKIDSDCVKMGSEDTEKKILGLLFCALLKK